MQDNRMTGSRMLGAMKRKASLTLNENCASPGGSQESYPHSFTPQKPEKRIRWDGSKTQSLIDHYRTHEYLWNPKLPDYKNDKKRTQCLEIWLEQNQLEKDLVNEVKMKLHGLRTSFGHQLKLESNNAEDKEDTSAFVSKWQWYSQLSFLKETMLFRSSSSSTNNNNSPVDSPPNLEHGQHVTHGTLAPSYPSNVIHHEVEDGESVKVEIPQVPLNMQIVSNYPLQTHEMHDYSVSNHHSQQQPHNLSMSVPMQESHNHSASVSSYNRKEEDDPVLYHHPRVPATPPVAHMQNLTSQHGQPQLTPSSGSSVSHMPHPTSDVIRYHPPGGCLVCNCMDRNRLTTGEKLGRLVCETFNNLHPDVQEMARADILRVLGMYLQKPIS